MHTCNTHVTRIAIPIHTDAQGKDIAALRWGVRYARSLSNTPAFKEYLQDEYWPGQDVQVRVV